MAKRIEDFTVTSVVQITNDIFILEIRANNYLPVLKPGQFIQIKVEGSPDTFLRRPFSIHDVDIERNSIRILFQVVGKATEKISKLVIGANINVIYPLGNSFTLPEKEERLLLIGGGCGIAPLLFLAKTLKSAGLSPEMLLGFRDAERVIEFSEYNALGKVYLTTEDGSLGEKGYVTSHSVLVEKQFDRIYCCGPEPMMKAVASWSKKNNVECEVSLENLMGCGFGVCLCCVVSTKEGNLCSCTDGPVFNIKELTW